MKRIGLYFGSFNPIHIGHLIVAEYFASLPGFDEVWFVVSPQNPHKPVSALADETHRLRMANLATADNALLRVSDIEFMLPRPSYTCDTLRSLQEKYPEHIFTLLMGEDNKASFHRWKDYLFILEHFPLRIFPRHIASTEGDPVDWKNYDVQIVDAPRIEISSTRIRQRLQDGQSNRYIIPDAVLAYIHQNKLYDFSPGA